MASDFAARNMKEHFFLQTGSLYFLKLGMLGMLYWLPVSILHDPSITLRPDDTIGS